MVIIEKKKKEMSRNSSESPLEISLKEMPLATCDKDIDLTLFPKQNMISKESTFKNVICI